MPYNAEVSRSNPSCFLFLIDQSGSMQDVLDPTNVQEMDRPMVVDGKTYTHSAQGRTKAQGVADAINRLLQNLAIKCAKSEGVRDYYYVGVIGYGAQVGPAFSGVLAGRDLVPISEIADAPARMEERTKKIEDGAGGLVDQTIRLPIWFDAVAHGGTPMCQALTRGQSVLSPWLVQHPSCYPPIVINITDGEATDGDPTMVAESLKNLSSNDGNVLLFNLHLSSQLTTPIEFPDSEDGLPDQFAHLLFRLSSVIPDGMRSTALQEGFPVTDQSRGFVFNAEMVSLIRFLDIGTRPSNLR